MARYVVLPCNRCTGAWAVETRSRTSRCPDCSAPADLRKRRALWSGDEAASARQAVMQARAGGMPTQAPPAAVPRHDDTLDAAAAQGRAIRNLSARAEEVTAWAVRLEGAVGHDRLVDALGRAGLSIERAEKEIIRMLVQDIVYEPKAGRYALLE